MKTTRIILLTLYLLLGSDCPAQEIIQPRPEAGVFLKWLGTAGWEIQVGQITILIGPFLTRKEPNQTGGEWKTDEEAVLSAIKRADFIFAGHSHADHIGDVPFIAKRFGSKVIGSRTTTNIALTGGVDKSQLVTIRGGEQLDFRDFAVQVIESEHGTLAIRGRKVRPQFEEITKPWSGPILGSSFVQGGCYLYYFTFGKLKLLHQSTGGFIEDNLIGLRPDAALLYPMERNDLAVMLKALQPKIVFTHHFDRQHMPFADGMPEQIMGRTRRFARDVASIDMNIKVVIPKYFESYHLE
jgi:L-ascorbate metabolism protein UlaG (beta-lactamase superfamily)